MTKYMRQIRKEYMQSKKAGKHPEHSRLQSSTYNQSVTLSEGMQGNTIS
jgi:hypothetical protein